jgi:hypothetical protein
LAGGTREGQGKQVTVIFVALMLAGRDGEDHDFI